MTNFLFWNLKKLDRRVQIARLAHHYNIDVLMFAENATAPHEILLELNRKITSRGLYDYSPQIGCEKIEIFTRFPRRFIPAFYEENRLTIRHLKLPGLKSVLLAIVHLPSKNHWKDSSQSAEAHLISEVIKKAESKARHSRTILVGDLNMSPFEDGVVNAAGFHGVMSKAIASKGKRIIQDREFPFFYNPMWNLLGDSTSGPPGTHYYQSAEHNSLFWHMFDQVLLRPSLLDCFDQRSLEIVTFDGTVNFLNAIGTPDENVGSDHLPITFSLNL